MVEREDYETCRPQSYEQLSWECSHPFRRPRPPRSSPKSSSASPPFTLGKEFRRGESYYYISKPVHHLGKECLSCAWTSSTPTAPRRPKREGKQQEACIIHPTDFLQTILL
ncbi:hypothetical protein SKAU_G00396400 [Synaphobranchus kaupii]|uniref:Ephrin-A1 n=1 Tax=Synaphobranchus kaupii TaxID=118154 RepID=A0A9Q1ECJ9_SYNKA|nr:hypothetical protein SKAU_G00396400 [Synaphobranchus kaupii]